MRILERGNINRFELKVRCEDTIDKNNLTWDSDKRHCGSLLGINEKDISYTPWKQYILQNEYVDYTVICPLCGCRLYIDQNLLPKWVKSDAKIRYTQRHVNKIQELNQINEPKVNLEKDENLINSIYVKFMEQMKDKFMDVSCFRDNIIPAYAMYGYKKKDFYDENGNTYTSGLSVLAAKYVIASFISEILIPEEYTIDECINSLMVDESDVGSIIPKNNEPYFFCDDYVITKFIVRYDEEIFAVVTNVNDVNKPIVYIKLDYDK